MDVARVAFKQRDADADLRLAEIFLLKSSAVIPTA